jgi:hypothetical protein
VKDKSKEKDNRKKPDKGKVRAAENGRARVRITRMRILKRKGRVRDAVKAKIGNRNLTGTEAAVGLVNVATSRMARSNGVS